MKPKLTSALEETAQVMYKDWQLKTESFPDYPTCVKAYFTVLGRHYNMEPHFTLWREYEQRCPGTRYDPLHDGAEPIR